MSSNGFCWKNLRNTNILLWRPELTRHWRKLHRLDSIARLDGVTGQARHVGAEALNFAALRLRDQDKVPPFAQAREVGFILPAPQPLANLCRVQRFIAGEPVQFCTQPC